LNILDSARHLGGLRAVELTCFRRLGGRAARLSPASCARWAASASLAHAWRASLLEDLLPVSVGLPGLDELTIVPPGTIADELARVLPVSDQGLLDFDDSSGSQGRDSAPDNGLPLVAGLCDRLYPLLLADYKLRVERASPAADGAIVRMVRRAASDLEIVLAEGAAICSRPA